MEAQLTEDMEVRELELIFIMEQLFIMREEEAEVEQLEELAGLAAANGKDVFLECGDGLLGMGGL